jgi:hypothetical protein
MIDACATLPHFVDHIAPIWLGLPDDLRGRFYAGPLAASRARDAGIVSQKLADDTGVESPMTIVSSYNDERHVPGRPVILVEHGAGQNYVPDGGYKDADRNSGYPGGRGRESVCLFLCPNEATAGRWSAMYPATPCEVVGAPKLDPWHQVTAKGFRVALPAKGALPLVVFSFHWDCQVVPECRSAFEHYKAELFRLARMSDEERGWRMGGHWHPKARDVQDWFRSVGVLIFDQFDDVLDEADLYVADNTSTLFEFASTDRPVVVLNAPWYRRNVEHGGRFWEWADVGVQCDLPEDVAPMIEDALVDYPKVAERRRRVVSEVYAYTDGQATDRAVAAVVREHEAGYWRAWRASRVSHDPRGAPIVPARLDGVRADVVRLMRERGTPLTAAEADGLHRASAGDLAQLAADLAR